MHCPKGNFIGLQEFPDKLYAENIEALTFHINQK